MLEGAAAGSGIALGWRHYIERLLEAGTLVALGDGSVEFYGTCYGVLTEEGRRKPVARRCLAYFDLDRTPSSFAGLRLAGSGSKRQCFDLYNFPDYGITVA